MNILEVVYFVFMDETISDLFKAREVYRRNHKLLQEAVNFLAYRKLSNTPKGLVNKNIYLSILYKKIPILFYFLYIISKETLFQIKWANMNKI